MPVRTTVVPGGPVIAVPHMGSMRAVLAKTGGGRKASAEPRKAKMSRIESRIFGDSFSLKTKPYS